MPVNHVILVCIAGYVSRRGLSHWHLDKAMQKVVFRLPHFILGEIPLNL